MIKNILLFISLLLLSSCSSKSGEWLDIFDYFECVKEYYTNVVLNDPEKYPEYSHSVVSNENEEHEVISYKGEYKLDAATDGFEAERKYSINFYPGFPTLANYYSTDAGLVKENSSYESKDYSFWTTMKLTIFRGKRTNNGERVFTFCHTPASYYYDDKGEIVDNELTQKMHEKMNDIMTNCLKVIDKYCRDNNKGIYIGGDNTDLDLFAK